MPLHRRCRAPNTAMENRFSDGNGFSSDLSRRRAERPRRRERSPKWESPQSKSIRERRSRLPGCAVPATKHIERGNTPRSLCHGHDPPSHPARHHTISRSATRDPDRTRTGRGLAAQRDPPGCRRRATGAVKKTPRSSRKPQIPTCGKTSRTAPASQKEPDDPEGRPTFAVEDAPFTVARSEAVRCRGWLYRQGQGQPRL